MEKIKSIENFRGKEIHLNNVNGGQELGPTGAGSKESAVCSSGVCYTSDYNFSESYSEYYGIYDCDVDIPAGYNGGGYNSGYGGDNGGLMP